MAVQNKGDGRQAKPAQKTSVPNKKGAGNGKKKAKQKKPASMMKKFIKIVCSIVFTFVILSFTVVLAYVYIASRPIEGTIGGPDSPQGPGKSPSPAPKSINVAVLGVDGKGADGNRTDVIFVVRYDPSTNKVKMVSVPRDTRVILTDEIIAEMKANKRYVPRQGVCKINEVHVYAGSEKANEYSIAMLEHLLGIKIDNYVKMDLQGFKNIVDAIDGVEMEVPQNMKYNDPYQDLYINLEKGFQTLDGEKAEQLVRFRRYPLGDETRVEVQQLFMKEFAKKLLSTETLLNNAVELLRTFFTYVDTDMDLVDALLYVPYATQLSVDNISMGIIPGKGEYVGAVSYYLYDEVEVKEFVANLFYWDDDEEEDESQEGALTLASGNSKNLNIELSNGGQTEGLAGRKKDALTNEGFTVVSVNTYRGEKTENTRIYVKSDGAGNDLLGYFNASPEVIKNSEMLDAGIDIKIVLGTKETD